MSDAVTSTSRQLVVFSLGSEEYAFPIQSVHEIIRYTEPRTVNSDVPWIQGVISLRGKIVSVHDLATRLGATPGDAAGERKIVIVEADGDQAGVVVDDVEEVLTVEAEQLDHVPGSADGAIEAIAKIDDRLVVLLDPAGVLGTAPVAA
ncbi:MAG TPA: chemotaxis protein CheW [Gaiellaceae bacterium]|jgi:purine-binding chemotaxis protein CheW|nr:chemotaxis protein CheW [Gaiellaceae bacterium]